MSVTQDEVTRAARTVTDVEPPPDLEARIRARLDLVTPAATPRRWPWVVGLATAAALALVSLSISPSPHVPISPSPHLPISSSPHLPISPSPHLLMSPSPHLPISTPVRLPAYRTVSEAELEWMARRVPALDLIDPIQPEPMAISPLTITPLMTSTMSGDPDEGRY